MESFFDNIKQLFQQFMDWIGNLFSGKKVTPPVVHTGGPGAPTEHVTLAGKFKLIQKAPLVMTKDGKEGPEGEIEVVDAADPKKRYGKLIAFGSSDGKECIRYRAFVNAKGERFAMEHVYDLSVNGMLTDTLPHPNHKLDVFIGGPLANKAEPFINGLYTCQVTTVGRGGTGDTHTGYERLVGKQTKDGFEAIGYEDLRTQNVHYFPGMQSFALPLKDGVPDMRCEAGKKALALADAHRGTPVTEHSLPLMTSKENKVVVSVKYKLSTNADPVIARKYYSRESGDMLATPNGRVTHCGHTPVSKSALPVVLPVGKPDTMTLSPAQCAGMIQELENLAPKAPNGNFSVLRVTELSPEERRAVKEKYEAAYSLIEECAMHHVVVKDHRNSKCYDLYMEAGRIRHSWICGYFIENHGKREMCLLGDKEQVCLGALGFDSHYYPECYLRRRVQGALDNPENASKFNTLFATLAEKGEKERLVNPEMTAALLSATSSPTPAGGPSGPLPTGPLPIIRGLSRTSGD